MRKLPKKASSRGGETSGKRAKKAQERKKKTSKTASKAAAGPKKGSQEATEKQTCVACSKALKKSQRVLFVEEEIGRVFCSEDCIIDHFGPEIDRLENEFLQLIDTEKDLTAEDRENLAELRWHTLRNPAEIWREKTMDGDYRHALIADYEFEGKVIWSICLTLFLRGEPSFLYVALLTSDKDVVEKYRRGEEVVWEQVGESEEKEDKMPDQFLNQSREETEESGESQVIDGLAEPWTEEETMIAQLRQERSDKDIPLEDYSLYHHYFEDVLQEPDEVWTFSPEKMDGKNIHHFIKNLTEEKETFYVVVARETNDDEYLEILDAFPTTDATLVERYRIGSQEAAVEETKMPTRTVH